MRIAMIGQKGMPATHGGVERHVHDLAVELVKAGHTVMVYGRSWYTNKIGTIMIDGVHIKHLPSINTKHFDTFTHTFFATLHAITQHFDTIHYHGVGPALLAWLPRIFCPKTKVVITFHSIDRYHQKWGWLAKYILRLGEKAAVLFAHETITVSRSLQTYCINEFNAETRYIPNGVTNTQSISDPQFLTKFGLKPNQYLLMVARLIPHKGAHILIDAFAQLKKQSSDEHIRSLKLVIVGGPAYTSNYVHDLHKQAFPCNDIIFTDFQSGTALSTLYANAQALVHPSLNEGLPITVLEAMNYGKPVLLSNIPEHLELVDNPEVIFKQNDPADLTSVLDWFINLSAEERKKLGEENTLTIKQKYQWSTIVPEIIEVYSSSFDFKNKKPLSAVTI